MTSEPSTPGVSSTHVRYGDDRESVHLYDDPGMNEATIPIQDALYEACSEFAHPRKTASFSGDATLHRIIICIGDLYIGVHVWFIQS